MADASLYEKLAITATGHLTSCLPITPGSNDPSPEAILSILAPEFRIQWGHNFFVTTVPPLQGLKTGEEFVQHLQGMAKSLQTWSINITQTCVDVQNKTVVLRADFHMVPKGGEEVLNDILFWIVMNEAGDKVVKVTEFIDPVASAELAKRMKGHSGIAQEK